MDRTTDNIFSLAANALRIRHEDGQLINDVKIKETIMLVAQMLKNDLTEEQTRDLAFRLGTQFSMDLSSGVSILSNPNTDVERGWLSSLVDPERTEFVYSRAFKQYLTDIGRPIKIIKENEKIVDEILELSGDPETPGEWERRGLVMGNVQSGKTQNYTALINKATDIGYKTIIILGGHQNELRNQTQLRVDEGFIGKQSEHGSRGKIIGVGKNRDLLTHGTHEGTRSEQDFNKPAARTFTFNLTGLQYPAIFVVKKLSIILETLKDWIEENHRLDPSQGIKLDQPLLFIDDEADYASPNTKQRSNKITATNKIIREILGLFKRNTYIGYTATPFANIFIDPDNDDDMLEENLFPKDFMIKVPTPKNYCGQDFFFINHLEEAEHSPLRLIDVEDHEKKLLPISGQKKWMADDINELPEKLKEATRAFFISTAVRFCRGDRSEHHTMIINVSHLADVQNKIKTVLGEYLQDLCDVLEATAGQNPDRAKENGQIREIYETYENIYFDIDEDWNNIFSELFNVGKKIKQYSINVNSPDKLDYKAYDVHGLVAIVVGGLKLSRGMTFEGLSVSYFARSSKMYDTLMQMCRWFGYRDNYRDLCRVYLTEDSISWYQHISESINELYDELDLMQAQLKTPSEFGLKVRDHPGALVPTARLKMGKATGRTYAVNLWGQRQRRFRWRDSEEINKKSLSVTESFIKKLDEDSEALASQVSNGNPSFIYSNVSHQDVINYINDMQMIEDEIGDRGLIKHIKTLESLPGDKKFKIVLRALPKKSETWYTDEMKTQGTDYLKNYVLAGKQIFLPSRIVSLKNGILQRPGLEMGEESDESWFLDAEEKERIKKEVKNASEYRKNASNSHYRRSPSRDFPGLIIYPFSLIKMTPFETKGKKKDGEYNLQPAGNFPHIGFALSFPIDEPELLNLSPNELRAVVRKNRTIYQTNAVFDQMVMDFGHPDDEENSDEWL